MSQRPSLSKGETEVVRAIWELGDVTVGAVHESLSEKRDIDYSTVQTYIRRLEAKGYLKARRLGRTKIYSANVRPKQVIGEAINDFLGLLFDGEMMPLFCHLIDQRNISEAEIKQLRKMLDEIEDDKQEGGGKVSKK